ncbi:MAG: metallophosphoesterase [Anaerolineae bacterium]|nr:metallophosphoesterase [Anaerolineae bacterium]
MKILAISDQVVKGIYSSHIRQRFGDVDMVLSCGDLPYSYLEYIVTLLGVPCFFVHGNHDHPEYTADGRTLVGPGGWTNLDGRTVEDKGVLLAGLEGSMRYKPRAPFQYTESEMAYKVWRLAPALLMNRLFHGRYLDILIAHSPPFGIHDGEDLPHRGFKTLLWFMARFRPRYLLHGHKHVYGPETWRTRYLDTEVVNVYPLRVIEW